VNNLKYLLIVLAFAFNACESIPDGVVEPTGDIYKVKSVNAPVDFVYLKTDSLLTTSIEFYNSASVSSVWLSIKSFDGAITVSQQKILEDNGYVNLSGDVKSGDNIYSAKIPISKKHPNGKYVIDYFVEDNDRQYPSNQFKVASHTFLYDSGQSNYAPVISELNVPASVNRGVQIVLSVKAHDPNGSSDIESVYYELYRPDGTKSVNSQGISKFPLFDNGINGDAAASDGIYSVYLTFPSNQPTGIWRFEFQAKDRSGFTSNTLTHSIMVN
jgi:hypothetical protein